ncbi:MAG: DUF1127 domain-containing protein [Roseiarcus sp.]|jgi:uncharacterized protein YjiS (DUF1127 family)
MFAGCRQDDRSEFRDDLVDRQARSEPTTGIGRAFTAIACAVARRYRTWTSRARERAQLARMSDRELQDISLTRYDARFEANKPFWRP